MTVGILLGNSTSRLTGFSKILQIELLISITHSSELKTKTVIKFSRSESRKSDVATCVGLLYRALKSKYESVTVLKNIKDHLKNKK